MKKFVKYYLLPILIIVFIICAIIFSNPSIKESFSNKQTLTILSGSENKVLEPILNEFEKENNVKINMVYKGSVDIMQELEKDNIPYDAVFPANSIWISMGDKNLKVKYQKSITTTPVVFGIKKSLAQSLGFVGRDVTTKDILDAIKQKKLKFMMTSATQSNSGATAYLGYIYALLGNPEVITKDSLNDKKLQEDITTLLSGVNRSSGSSEWLEELFLNSNYDAMVNYEALIIDTNKKLVAQNKEPLYVIYPKDGLTIADSPLGYIDNGDSKKQEIFLKLQQYLLSDSTKQELIKLGRRTGYGLNFETTDTDVFNPDWGIDTKKVLNVMKMPASDVIELALNKYQTDFRKPSLTVYCLDYSGSMYGDGENKLKSAMDMLLDSQKASQYLIQTGNKDVNIVIPFSDRILDIWKSEGNNTTDLKNLDNKISGLQTGGGTNIYLPIVTGIDEIKKYDYSNYNVAFILLTDGNSNSGSINDVKQKISESNIDAPIFSITFGDASLTQLNELADFSKARVFDGKSDLQSAFKQAKGYN